MLANLLERYDFEAMTVKDTCIVWIDSKILPFN